MRVVMLTGALVVLFTLNLFCNTLWEIQAASAPIPVASTLSGSATPRTDGKTIVWTDLRGGDPQAPDVYGANLATGAEFAIATGPSIQSQPDVDGNTVVWAQNDPNPNREPAKIHATNLATGQEFVLGNGFEPAISGHYVVWYDADGVFARDISAMTPPIRLDTLTPNIARPAIEGNRVVWGNQAIGGNPRSWRLLTFQFGDSKPTVLDEGGATFGLRGWDLYGDIVVYSVDYDLKMINLKTGEHRNITDHNQLPAANPTTNGRYIFWEDNRPVAQSQGDLLNLQGYDITTGSYFGVAANNGYNSAPQARGDFLVWQKGQLPQSNVLSSRISELLPSYPVAAPTKPNPDITYFPQTGHNLSFGFKYFWDHNGSLPVFGFPLTEEFSELNPDTGQTYTVQYFERQRYEYHPDHKGTPYETELGRLGVQDARQRDLTRSAPFQPVTGNSDSNCIFFAETGHKACGEFKSYWLTHGLDFGDAGFSFRESLALFGYPVSEEFKDVSTGITIQYFERAVFEYHPENAEPYKILLRRLGAELISQRG